MKDLTQKTAFEFLQDEIYLPGYMLLSSEDYDTKGATFNFNVKEPPVAREDLVHYFTPRGLHICVSQAGYALVENMLREGRLEGFELQELRGISLEGRVKITELYQKFRKEVGLLKPIQGRFNIEAFRSGKMPVLKLDFGFENNAITGYLTSVIAPKPVPQTNYDIIRI